MRSRIVKKWLAFIATGSFLFQTAGACDTTQLSSLVATSAQSFIGSVVSLYVDAAVTSLLNT
ncbi:MAG: hypothetical protein JSV03_16610 [Planctomycetota bacterium]|nr:MAG: hypothetical protein JSV03_16610 [Planctomycetota bacterium]